MIKNKARVFEVSNKKLFIRYLLIFSLLIISVILEIKFVNFGDMAIYIGCSLIMLLLFVRVDRRQVAYYWIKKNKLSKCVLLDIKGDFLPLRFFISHLYFYVQLLIGVAIYMFIMFSPLEIEINVAIFTYLLIVLLNLFPFIAFVIIEVIENRKCKDIKF